MRNLIRKLIYWINLPELRYQTQDRENSLHTVLFEDVAEDALLGNASMLVTKTLSNRVVHKGNLVEFDSINYSTGTFYILAPYWSNLEIVSVYGLNTEYRQWNELKEDLNESFKNSEDQLIIIEWTEVISPLLLNKRR